MFSYLRGRSGTAPPAAEPDDTFTGAQSRVEGEGDDWSMISSATREREERREVSRSDLGETVAGAGQPTHRTDVVDGSDRRSYDDLEMVEFDDRLPTTRNSSSGVEAKTADGQSTPRASPAGRMSIGQHIASEFQESEAHGDGSRVRYPSFQCLSPDLPRQQPSHSTPAGISTHLPYTATQHFTYILPSPVTQPPSPPPVPTLAFTDAEVPLDTHLKAVREHVQNLEEHVRYLQSEQNAFCQRADGLQRQLRILLGELEEYVIGARTQTDSDRKNLEASVARVVTGGERRKVRREVKKYGNAGNVGLPALTTALWKESDARRKHQLIDFTASVGLWTPTTNAMQQTTDFSMLSHQAVQPAASQPRSSPQNTWLEVTQPVLYPSAVEAEYRNLETVAASQTHGQVEAATAPNVSSSWALIRRHPQAIVHYEAPVDSTSLFQAMLPRPGDPEPPVTVPLNALALPFQPSRETIQQKILKSDWCPVEIPLSSPGVVEPCWRSIGTQATRDSAEGDAISADSTDSSTTATNLDAMIWADHTKLAVASGQPQEQAVHDDETLTDTQMRRQRRKRQRSKQNAT